MSGMLSCCDGELLPHCDNCAQRGHPSIFEKALACERCQVEGAHTSTRQCRSLRTRSLQQDQRTLSQTLALPSTTWLPGQCVDHSTPLHSLTFQRTVELHFRTWCCAHTHTQTHMYTSRHTQLPPRGVCVAMLIPDLKQSTHVPEKTRQGMPCAVLQLRKRVWWWWGYSVAHLFVAIGLPLFFY